MSETETVKVKVIHANNLQNQIITKGYTIMTDEPKESGGDELAPNPIELLLGAEGACTISVIMMFAKRMKYNLKGVEINLIYKRVKASGVNIDNEKGYVHKIEKNIKFIGNLDDDAIGELQGVSKRCPVHNIIAKRSYFDISFEYSNVSVSK